MMSKLFLPFLETLRKTEARLLADHLEQTHDLNQRLNDRNSRVEEIVQNCEAQIQVRQKAGFGSGKAKNDQGCRCVKCKSV